MFDLNKMEVVSQSPYGGVVFPDQKEAANTLINTLTSRLNAAGLGDALKSDSEKALALTLALRERGVDAKTIRNVASKFESSDFSLGKYGDDRINQKNTEKDQDFEDNMVLKHSLVTSEITKNYEQKRDEFRKEVSTRFKNPEETDEVLAKVLDVSENGLLINGGRVFFPQEKLVRTINNFPLSWRKSRENEFISKLEEDYLTNPEEQAKIKEYTNIVTDILKRQNRKK